jgi:RNA polymerase sigma factor (sigma-70 family)
LSLQQLSKHHKEWVSIVRTFGETLYCEDIVQEMYLRFDKYATPEKVIVNDKVNKSFIWVMLRNIYFDKLKQEKKIDTCKLDSVFNLKFEESNFELINSENILTEKINTTIKKLHFFDAGLIKLYFEKDMSMRDIASETGIGLTTVFLSLNKSKDILRKEIGEDYEDLINDDLEWLKR